jgi:uncharacterized membrane protein YdjX (TVP38/TMEM64 family)
MRSRAGLVAVVMFVAVVALCVWWFAPSILTDAKRLMDRDTLMAFVAQAGLWGPVLIVSLMVVAVVASPLPSAPIALAAGAAYGHLWGTVQVVLGAELGALIAFGLARVLGRDALRHMFGDKVDAGLLGSQNALMATVFASRLMPFVSFDLISYAAGLSGLQAWRFAVATLAGIVPASFVLVYLGGEAASGDMGRATWAVLGLGLFTGLPLLWVATKRGAQGDRT